MRFKTLILATLLSLSLQGCVTMSKSGCLSADWSKVGFEDGMRGLQLSYLDEHLKTCGKHGVSPHEQNYESGYRAGIKVYCKPQNGYQLGIDGKEYHYFCPDQSEPEFVKEYIHGLNIKIDQLENERRALFERIQGLQRNLSNQHNPAARENISNSLEFYENHEREIYDQINQLREWANLASLKT